MQKTQTSWGLLVRYTEEELIAYIYHYNAIDQNIYQIKADTQNVPQSKKDIN